MFTEMEAGVMKICWEMEAGSMKRILLKWKRDWWKVCCWNGSGNFYKINILFCDELSATNCPRRVVLRRIVRDELFATSCSRRIVLRRIVWEPEEYTAPLKRKLWII